MEKDQGMKLHLCKFCNKGFPCGRSLGGHMRSHLINSDDQTHTKSKKLSLAKNGVIKSNTHYPFHGLTDIPKKTCKFADSSGDTLFHDKLCRECGKGFKSWKALFGHMKCHSDKVPSIVEEDSCTSAIHKQVTDSQSDGELVASNRKKRSSRRATTRYTNNTASSSLSVNANDSLGTVSEMEQELDEAATCLMMLSRDVGDWGGLNSVAESSDNNSDFLEAKNLKFKKIKNGKLESTVFDSENFQFNVKQSELAVSGISRIGSELEKSEVLVDESITELGKNSMKRKCCDSFGSDVYKLGSQRSKFECTSCNRTFHSYQALGGHRASHNKTKGCFVSKTDSGENNIATVFGEEKLIKSCNKGNNIDQEELAGYGEKGETSYGSNKSKGHECPICFKVFSSGQALGGHKRSHLVGVSEARINQAIVIRKPIPEIRDPLDLNLPAPVEEESNGNGNGHVGFKPWWVDSNHKHEPLVSLLSS